MSHGIFMLVLVLLFTAVVTVPLFHKIRLGSVLGYLVGGLIVGPYGLSLVHDVESIAHLSEFGIVLFLFLIGLELEPKKLWELRVKLFGLGGMQVVLTTLIVATAAHLLGLSWAAALAIGMGFAHSSTAIALQVLKEKGVMGSSAGQNAFSLLLFQDIAVVPMLSILGLLAADSAAVATGSGWMQTLKVISVFAVILLIGRFILRPVFRFIASIHLREVFTALSLLLVFGMAAAMQMVELSMGLGAFLAGVLLADSEYRAALETDIEPFKGLLLGLFFMSVGMSLDLNIILNNPLSLIGITLLVVAVKMGVLYSAGKIFKTPKNQIPLFTIVVSQVGEFAFVLLASAKGLNIITEAETGFATAVVTLSMVCTSILIWMHNQFYEKHLDSKPEADTIEDQGNSIIICGFGRFGQIMGRMLYANKFSATVLDYEPDQVELLRKFGFKVFFGDATRLDLLEAAGIARAKILVAAIDNAEENLRLIDLVREHFPNVKIFARARNVQAVYDMMDRKVHRIERETFESSLRLGTELLTELGFGRHQAFRAANLFREHNIDSINVLYATRDNQAEFIAKSKQTRIDLEKMFEREAVRREHPFSAWSPKTEASEKPEDGATAPL